MVKCKEYSSYSLVQETVLAYTSNDCGKPQNFMVIPTNFPTDTSTLPLAKDKAHVLPLCSMERWVDVHQEVRVVYSYLWEHKCSPTSAQRSAKTVLHKTVQEELKSYSVSSRWI
jgi:hypothetical protein